MPSSDSEKARIASSTVQALECAALLGHRERMDQRGADQPGHERGVFHRIPEPPAAPAEFVVGPVAAERDAEGEEDPRRGGPGARPARPGGVEPAVEQCRDGEGEGHREADVAHVEHRRMEHHARVLQQRIEVAALGDRGQQALEGVRGEQHEGVEADADQAHHAENARHHGLRQGAREHAHRQHPDGHHQHPQQERTFVTAPHPRQSVGERQLGVRMTGDVFDREIVLRKRPGKRGEGDRNEDELALRGGPRQRHQRFIAARRADQRQRALHQRDAQREDQREVAEFGDHLAAPALCAMLFTARSCAWRAFSTASAASGAM